MKTNFKKVIKRIESTNDKFDNLSVEEKKMAIAQDVIDRVLAEQLIAERGTIIYFNDSFKRNCSVKDIINTEQVTCNCCAKGALFLSYVGRVNEMLIRDIQNDTEHNSNEMMKLIEIFHDEEELAGIEAAFEGYLVVDMDSDSNYLDDDDNGYLFNCRFYADEYEEKYGKNPNSQERLLSICKNIIKNKGRFDPTDIVHANLSISFRF